jgi:putative membrane-bound dehydrogenase-like protein
LIDSFLLKEELMIKFRYLPFSCFVCVALFLILSFQSLADAGEQIINGQKFTLPDGFNIELISNPSLVKRPICADFDEEGRLYVADSSGSNEKVKIQLEKKPHRIVRLEDTNHDGIYDKSIVFADKMMFPEGTLWHDGSLYVGAPPHIWKLTDTNQDGVADKREKWFDGKTLTGCANDLHGPYLGPDGWIYWCKGAFAEQKYEKRDGSEFVTRAAHIFRRHPEGGLVEPVMTGGMDNPVELVFTNGGERIFSTTFLKHPSSGLRDGIIHAIYGGVYGKTHGVLDGHPRTGPVMPVLSHMGAAAPCGLLYVNSVQLGKEYQHNVLTCSFNMHKITRNVLKPDGATFETKLEDFLICDDLDFHPTDVLEDADGSLVVIDTGGWYKLCCPTSQMTKPDILGAIYRIKRNGSHKTADANGQNINWPELSTKELVSLLADPRPFVRKHAKQLLTKPDFFPVDDLQQAIASSNNTQQRIEAVWTLTRIESFKARAAVRTALQDENETVRQAALHSISIHRDREAKNSLIVMLNSGSAHNSRAAAEALGRIGITETIPNLLAATAHANGRTLEHSLIYAVLEIGDADSVRKALESPNGKIHRAALIALDQLEGNHLKATDIIPLLNSENVILNKTAWWITNHHLKPEWVSQYKPYFQSEFLRNHKNKERLTQLSLRLAKYSRNSNIQQAMAEGLANKKTNRATKLAIINAMSSSSLKSIPSFWSKPLLDQLDTSDSFLLNATVSVVHRLSASNPNNKFISRLNKIANNPELSTSVRLQALAATPPAKQIINESILSFLCSNLSTEISVHLRSLAVDVLTTAPLDKNQLLIVANSMKNTGPMELKRLMEMFGKSGDGQIGHQLVNALLQNPALTSLSIEHLKQQLSGFGAEVIQQSKPLIERIEKENADKIKKIEDVLSLISNGDIRRGQKVFHSTKTSCIACHGMGYLGGRIGPDLTRIGSIRTERDLLESILFPSVSFVRSYEPVMIATEDGIIYNGVLKDETDHEVHLQLDAQKSIRIPVSDIDERQPGKLSIMPEGLLKNYSTQEIADLIVFLKASK